MSDGAVAGGPSYFKVWTKSGQIFEYGNTTDSRIEAKRVSGSFATWPTGTVRVWAVNKISDTVGNYLAYSYTEDDANGDFYPLKIDYTGNAAASLTPFNSVQFVYESSPDITPVFHPGARVRNVVRLQKVVTAVGTTPLREYRLTYTTDSGSGRSLVASVTECTASGSSCMPAIVPSWSSGAASTRPRD